MKDIAPGRDQGARAEFTDEQLEVHFGLLQTPQRTHWLTSTISFVRDNDFFRVILLVGGLPSLIPVHLATIAWQRGKRVGAKGKYSREHLWHLVGGETQDLRLPGRSRGEAMRQARGPRAGRGSHRSVQRSAGPLGCAFAEPGPECPPSPTNESWACVRSRHVAQAGSAPDQREPDFRGMP